MASSDVTCRFWATKKVGWDSTVPSARLGAGERASMDKLVEPAYRFSFGPSEKSWRQESLGLRWKDVNFDYKDAGLIRLFRTKNSHERTEFLMPRIKEALLNWKTYLEWMRKKKRIEPVENKLGFYRLNGIHIKRFDMAWRHVRALAGLDDFHYHDLMHTFCSSLILSGSNLKEVKDMIGHRDLSTTDRYSHLHSSA